MIVDSTVSTITIESSPTKQIPVITILIYSEFPSKQFGTELFSESIVPESFIEKKVLYKNHFSPIFIL